MQKMALKSGEAAVKTAPAPTEGDGKSLADYIVDGEITVASVEAFACVLKLFPEHAGLHKRHADLLLAKNLRYAAAKAYAQASDLFVQAGKVLPAVSARLSQWQIIPSSDEENQRFLEQIRNGAFAPSPIKSFFSRLSDQAMMAVFTCLQQVQVPAGATVRSPDEEEKELYLVVSGTLRESACHITRAAGNDKNAPTVLLGSGDSFGDVYPFSKVGRSRSTIEAVSRVELIRLSKAHLQRLCRDHRNVEVGLLDLCKVRSESGAAALSRMIRGGVRYENLIAVSLEVYPDATEGFPLTIKAYAQDISIGGIRLVLSSQDPVVPTLVASHRKTLLNNRARVGLPWDQLSLKIAGRIAWCRPVCLRNKKTLALGIQFEDMPPKLRGMFFACVEGLGTKT